ncbi:hypothetical protein DID88_008737 [Monilinia fructigena]|uniref:P/Homo B domain-containing protein n=1 Tax=Monilinia fructigena TaxID=38457 RepID=A0A395J8N8_9HELO|nr:hypothetical protein DID88_008737 [Monilinia fructigena]
MITDADEAVAMNYAFQHNQIYSCSWGPPDDGRSMDAPGILIKRAMLNAVQKGRGGLGSVYVFASGNVSRSEQSTERAYTHIISEKCSAQLVVTYSSGSGGDSIHTTDVGTNVCSSAHGGTSAAAPLAAGIFALVLQIRPDLTWRDMQYLVLSTAVPVDLETGEWQTTTIGKKFSHTFGYGKIDTWATIEAAKNYKNLKPQAWFYSPWIHVNQAIPQGDAGISVSFEVTKEMLQEANLERLEHVQVTMNNKLVSHLSASRRYDSEASGYDDWTFMSVVHWGESGVGTWTITVKDTFVNEHNGTFTDWHLKLWGEAIDPEKATQTRNPNGTSQRSIRSSRSSYQLSKPSGTEDQLTSPTATTPAAAESTTSSTWIPSFLPTFGVSSKTQIWIYGALGLIVTFCAGLGAYLYMARRKRLRNNPRDEWEFDLLEEDEAEALAGNTEMTMKKGGKRRAGELYDAFAAGSDDEEEEYRDGSNEREKKRYEDDRESEGTGSGSGHHVVGDNEDDSDDESAVNVKDEKKPLRK